MPWKFGILFTRFYECKNWKARYVNSYLLRWLCIALEFDGLPDLYDLDLGFVDGYDDRLLCRGTRSATVL